MKSFFKYILFLILLNVGLVAKSETIYPIQLYATMLPPYTNCISDYITDGMHRMKLTAVVRDMNNHSFNQVRVLIQVKGNDIKYAATTYPVVLGQAKMMHEIPVTALNEQIINSNSKNGCLEEGAYEFVFQVFDAHNSSLPLSEPVSIYCYLDEPEPPVCIYPKDGDCIKDGGVINFTWMDAVASNLSSKEYKFELLEDITPEQSNSDLLPMFGDKDIAGKKGILERTIYNSNVYTLNYAGQLQTGRKYYWRVTNVTDASKANYTNGANKYSELSSFTFGDCNPATPEEVKKEVEELSEKLEIKSVDTDSKSVSATITWGLEGSDDVDALKKFCKYKLYFTRKKNSNESVDATASESNEENQDSETDDNKPDEDSNVKSVDDITDEFVVEVGNVNTYTITSVERTQIYNVRVEGITCDENKEISGKTDKSEPKDFMIPQLESEECNTNIKEVECQSLATLEKGASFFANDDNVVVKVTELDQSKSNDETHVYSGKGIVSCTIFKEKLGLNVEFKNIKVNKDNHLCDGVVEVVSSEENNLMVNLNDVAGKGRTASKAPEQKEVKNVENKEEITDPKKNQEHRNNVVTNGSTLYAVNNTGGSESVGTLVNDVTPSTSSLDNEDGVVLFDVEKNLENNSWTPYIDMGAYPFLNTSIVRDYERMGGSYIVPWLAMESGDFKWIKAKPTLKDNKDIKRFDDLNFYAKIGENYYQLDSKKIENGNSFDYNVKVFGADANKSYSIYAMSKDKSKTFGRLKVYSMKNKEIKVKLVPVINKVEFENSLTDFQDRLNKIFEPLAKKFIFKMDEKPFTNDDIKEPIDEQQNLDFLNEGLNTSEGSDIFANETKEMKWLRKLYQKNTSDDNSYDAYLFLIPKNTESEIKGFMPRTYSVGYLFVGEDGEKYDDINTAAHELCHGVFGLQHAFDYEGVVKGGVEENLMDYSTADIFRYPSKYFQWYNIENPSDYHFPFVDTPEDGEVANPIIPKCVIKPLADVAFDQLDKLCDKINEIKEKNGETALLETLKKSLKSLLTLENAADIFVDLCEGIVDECFIGKMVDENKKGKDKNKKGKDEKKEEETKEEKEKKGAEFFFELMKYIVDISKDCGDSDDFFNCLAKKSGEFLFDEFSGILGDKLEGPVLEMLGLKDLIHDIRGKLCTAFNCVEAVVNSVSPKTVKEFKDSPTYAIYKTACADGEDVMDYLYALLFDDPKTCEEEIIFDYVSGKDSKDQYVKVIVDSPEVLGYGLKSLSLSIPSSGGYETWELSLNEYPELWNPDDDVEPILSQMGNYEARYVSRKVYTTTSVLERLKDVAINIFKSDPGKEVIWKKYLLTGYQSVYYLKLPIECEQQQYLVLSAVSECANSSLPIKCGKMKTHKDEQKIEITGKNKKEIPVNNPSLDPLTPSIRKMFNLPKNSVLVDSDKDKEKVIVYWDVEGNPVVVGVKENSKKEIESIIETKVPDCTTIIDPEGNPSVYHDGKWQPIDHVYPDKSKLLCLFTQLNFAWMEGKYPNNYDRLNTIVDQNILTLWKNQNCNKEDYSKALSLNTIKNIAKRQDFMDRLDNSMIRYSGVQNQLKAAMIEIARYLMEQNGQNWYDDDKDWKTATYNETYNKDDYNNLLSYYMFKINVIHHKFSGNQYEYHKFIESGFPSAFTNLRVK
ncbi:MAG: hypothetical protein IKQ08_08210 [Paludibacteraceae bacterium]|nr:hypothetical protein [Paludibacteraceae bacterium]